MNYKVEAWSWCADYCKKNQWNPHDSYFWNKANLEYRRQHNIFEKEDFVVHIFYKGSKVQRVKGVAGDYIYVFSHDESYQYKAYGPDFRHATDAEIKAGKRLEVKSEN